MNQQEWIEYFELVNGRKPSPAELAQAQAAGEFILERPNVFGATGQANEPRKIKPAEPVIAMTQQPQFAQTTATFQQAMPVKKGMSKKSQDYSSISLGCCGSDFTFCWWLFIMALSVRKNCRWNL